MTSKKKKTIPKASEVQLPIQDEYYSIEKISQTVHRLVKLRFEDGDVIKEVIREDIPEMVRAKFHEFLYNAPLTKDVSNAVH